MTTGISDSGVTFADGNTQATAQVPVRQTVLSGPVDTNGQSAFGGSTGSTTVTATGTLVMTAANGLTNRVGTKVNPSWTGLSTNGTMYLYADVNADGTITEGSNALIPVQQWGGTPSTVAGQFTYNIQQNSGFIGNGTVATAGYRVYVGEVTVAAGVVSAIVWYALSRKSYVEAVIPATGTAIVFTHNIGIPSQFLIVQSGFRCITADASSGAAVGDFIPIYAMDNGVAAAINTFAGRLSTTVNGSYASIAPANKSTGGRSSMTVANFKAVVIMGSSW